MRAFLVVLVLAFPAAIGWAETFDLGEQGRLEVFPVGEWEIRGEDVGEIKIQLTPKNPQMNAACQISVSAGGPDEFPTKARLSRKVSEVAGRMAESGQFVETSPNVKAFYCKQGFGFYCTFTDPKLVGRAPVSGDFKNVSVGMIRLSAGVMIAVQILSDGEKTGEFQELQGAVEGMELHSR